MSGHAASTIVDDGYPGSDPQATAPGVYGLRLEGLADSRMLRLLGPEAPVLRIEREPPSAWLPHDVLGADTAELRLHDGRVSVDRRTLLATFRVPEVVTDDEIVHPFLAGVAAVVSRWLGREVFHAGAFCWEGGAWALLGDKGAGKSSTLAWLTTLGAGLVTDDLLVVERGLVLPGPCCVDLREEAAERLAIGEPLGTVGSRERWRAMTLPVSDTVPLRGWVFLTWGDRVEVVSVPPAARTPRLLEHVAVRAPLLQPGVYLDFAQLPCFELLRPPCWDSLAAAAPMLLERLSGARSGPTIR